MTVTNLVNDRNGTLAVLEGAVAVRGSRDDEDAVRLVSGEAMDMTTGRHAVTTVSATPSCYVYATTTVTRASGDDDSPRSATADGSGGRPGCSDACYAFAVDALKATFSAIFGTPSGTDPA